MQGWLTENQIRGLCTKLQRLPLEREVQRHLQWEGGEWEECTDDDELTCFTVPRFVLTATNEQGTSESESENMPPECWIG